jgi:hypothetical protein
MKADAPTKRLGVVGGVGWAQGSPWWWELVWCGSAGREARLLDGHDVG